MTASLHVCIFLWNGCVTERKYSCPLKQEVPSTSVFQTLSKSAILECHHAGQTSVRKPKTKAPGAGMRRIIRYPLTVITKARRLRRSPNGRLPPAVNTCMHALNFRPFLWFSQDAFHKGFDLRGAP